MYRCVWAECCVPRELSRANERKREREGGREGERERERERDALGNLASGKKRKLSARCHTTHMVGSCRYIVKKPRTGTKNGKRQ
jgi:hypothetical protein